VPASSASFAERQARLGNRAVTAPGSRASCGSSPVGAISGLRARSVSRFASLDIHHDPSQQWVFVFVILAVAGLLAGLFVPRRRVWVKAVEADGGILLEYAGLARGEDPGLDRAVADLADRHIKRLTS